MGKDVNDRTQDLNNEGNHTPRVILSPSDSAMPCVLLRIRTWPCICPVSSTFSMLRFARASSPGKQPQVRTQACVLTRRYSPNKLRAYMFADRKSQSPDRAPSGVKHDMFVDFMMWSRYSRKSLYSHIRTVRNSRDTSEELERTYVIEVLTFTLFSHSNSVHMLRNYSPHITGLVALQDEVLRQTHMSLVTVRRFDIIHDINVNVTEHNGGLAGPRLPDDVPKNDAGFGGGHLDKVSG